MLRQILVGLDGSAYSDAAVELAIRWARQFNASIVGLGILDAPTIHKPTGLYLGSGHKVEADILHLAEAQAKVQELLANFDTRCEQAGVPGRSLQDVGTPKEQLLREAQTMDLIMLGKKTYFHFETQEGPDKVLFEVVENATRPVVTVPKTLPAEPGPAQNGTGSSSIIIAYDGSYQVARALHAFVPTALWKFHDLHVVSVNRDLRTAELHAAIAVDYLALHEIPATVHAVEGTRHVSEVLQEKVAEVHATLVVMGAYGRTRLHEFVFGSETVRMLKSTTVPLFLYH